MYVVYVIWTFRYNNICEIFMYKMKNIHFEQKATIITNITRHTHMFKMAFTSKMEDNFLLAMSLVN